MEKSKINLSRVNQCYGILSLWVLLAAFSRVIPHPYNFVLPGALAMFGAVYLSKMYVAGLLPVFSLSLSNLCVSHVIYAHLKLPASSFNTQFNTQFS